MLRLEPLDQRSARFAFECLKELRGGAVYDFDAFVRFLDEYGLHEHHDFRILIAFDDGQPIGLLTCNRFAMPRYLGFGYDLEEVVIHPSRQGQGYGKMMIEAFLTHVETEPEIRKVIVRTDDTNRAAFLYAHYFTQTTALTFARTIRHYQGK